MDCLQKNLCIPRNCTKKKEWKLVAHKKKLRKSKKRGSTIGLLQDRVFQTNYGLCEVCTLQNKEG